MLRQIRKLRNYSAKCRQDRTYHGTALLLAVLILFVGVYDVISTNAALAAGNWEVNALVASLQRVWGDGWLIAKIIIHGALAVVILWLPSRRMIRNARLGIALYALIIASNFHLADWQI